MENPFLSNKKIKIIVLIEILLLSILLIHFKNHSDEPLIPVNESFSMLSYIQTEKNGNQYIVDRLNKIIVLDKNNQFLFQIASGKNDETAFKLTNSLCVDEEGFVYVADVRTDNRNDRYDMRTRILKYSPKGIFVSVLFDKVYVPPYPLFNTTLLDLEYYNERIYFVNRIENGCQLFSLASDGSEAEPVEESFYSYAQADIFLLDFAIEPAKKSIYATSKSGDIFAPAENRCFQKIYDGGKPYNDFFEIPFYIDLNDTATKLYYTDIGTREIYSIDTTTLERKVLFDGNTQKPLDEREIFYRVKATAGSENKFSFCSNNISYQFSENGEISAAYDYSYSASTTILHILLVLCMLTATVLLFYLIVQFLIYCFILENNTLLQTNIFTLTAIILIFLFLTTTLLRYTDSQYYAQTIKSLSGLSQMAANYVDGDNLEKIDSPKNYMDENYKLLSQQVEECFSSRYDWVESTYCTIYRNFSNVVTYVLFTANQYGFYTDSFPYQNSDYQTILKTNEPLICDVYKTPEGSWMYVSTPIYNSNGKIVGVAEVGADLTSYTKNSNKMLTNILLQIIPLTIIAFLLMSELISFCDTLKQIRKKRQSKSSLEKKHLPISFVKNFAFVIYMADNFTSILIPILSMRLYSPNFGVTKSIAIALPTGAYSLLLTLSSLFAGQMLMKVGVRKMFLMGCSIHAISLFLCGFGSHSFLLFTLAMSMAGIGMGFNISALNGYIVERKEEQEQNLGFSLLNKGILTGTNCGMILGTSLAMYADYSIVFFVSGLFSLYALLLTFLLIGKNHNLEKIKKEIDLVKSKSLFDFCRQPQILLFFLLSMAPYFMIVSFVFYFIPLYASSQGLTESYIGILTLFYCIFASYLSPVLTRHILNKIGGKKSYLIAGSLTLLSLLLFAIFPISSMLIFIVVLMGIADSLGNPSLSVNFVNMDEVKDFGEVRAMGVYSVYDGIAQTIGPFLFSAALVLGVTRGLLIVSIGFGICLLLYAALIAKRR